MKEFLEKLHDQLEDAILNTPRPGIRAAQKEIEAKLAEIIAHTPRFVEGDDGVHYRISQPVNRTKKP